MMRWIWMGALIACGSGPQLAILSPTNGMDVAEGTPLELVGQVKRGTLGEEFEVSGLLQPWVEHPAVDGASRTLALEQGELGRITADLGTPTRGTWLVELRYRLEAKGDVLVVRSAFDVLAAEVVEVPRGGEEEIDPPEETDTADTDA